ncbi:DUF3277 domain-containing protein [Metabacillus idriensis]|uniref:phage structural protein n=1 Tax=Metabacillus idriensis TaxID=324768 RepID=UPI00203BD2C5|nr:phage protein [Metabacillus idriensis]MCM3598715.1 DUF3277 domain-containing protein [Metabacillus idriensis]
MPTYDASLVTVVVDGRFITGFDEGDMVSWEKDEDNFTPKVDAQGFTAAAVVNNNLGTITIPLSQASPQLKFMKNLANTRKKFSIWIQSPDEKIGGTEAMVKKTPEGSFGDEISAREFEIQVFDYTDE